MTKIEGFRPQLYPNEAVKAEDVKYPQLISTKMDGIRCIITDGQVLSRTFKPIQNLSLVKRLQPLVDFANKHNILLDGELYSPEMPFNVLSGEIRRIDSEAPSSIKFHAFDCLKPDALNMGAEARYNVLCKFAFDFMESQVGGQKLINVVQQTAVKNAGEVMDTYETFLENGFEGAILKSPSSKYKFGRVTVKSGDGYKFKPYLTFDATIIGIEEATVAREGSEKKIDAFGHSKTSAKLEDRIPCGMAASFIVMFEGFEAKPTLPMTHEMKKYIWEHQSEFIGRPIEFGGMRVGSKDRVRHPKFLRYRDDRDDLKLEDQE